MPRLVVAQPDNGPARWVPTGLLRDPEGRRWTLIVKVTLAFPEGAGGRATVAAEQLPLSSDRLSELPGAADDELAYAADLEPPKPRADVLLTGHARTVEAARSVAVCIRVGSMDARLRGGRIERRVTAVAPDAGRRIPLSSAHLRDVDGESSCDPVGPHRSALNPDDALVQQLAPPSQRLDALAPDVVISLEGLSDQPRRYIQLPSLVPHVALEGIGIPARTVAMTCDTLWIDVDRELLVLVWRGVSDLDLISELSVDRAVIWLEALGASLDETAQRNRVAHGTWGFAVEREDLESPEVSADDAQRLALDKRLYWLELWGDDRPQEPELTLEQYAQISAELAEAREEQAALLSRHELDEDRWLLAEQAWLMKLADAAQQGDEELAAAFGELFVATQDGLAQPAEAERGEEDYLTIRSALEQAEDPAAALEEQGLTVPEWMRLERRFMKAALADPQLAARIRRGLAARSKPEPEQQERQP